MDYNPVEFQVFKRVEENIKQDTPLKMVNLKQVWDNEKEYEVSILQGKFAAKSSLTLLTTFGSGASEMPDKVFHTNGGTSENKEYSYGFEFWTLTSSSSKETTGRLMQQLSTLAVMNHNTPGLLRPGVILNVTAEPGQNENQPSEGNKEFTHVMLLGGDLTFKTAISPVKQDDMAVHWVFVLPIYAREAKQAETNEGLVLIEKHLTTLGVKSYGSSRPITPENL